MATQLEWVADEDVVLVAAISTEVGFLTLDAQLTFTAWAAALQEGASEKFFVWLTPLAGNNSKFFSPQLGNYSFSFKAGTKIFAALASTGQLVQMFFKTADETIVL